MIEANIAGRKSAEQVFDLINGEMAVRIPRKPKVQLGHVCGLEEKREAERLARAVA